MAKNCKYREEEENITSYSSDIVMRFVERLSFYCSSSLYKTEVTVSAYERRRA